LLVFDGKEQTAGGRYDTYVLLAESHNWTPEQVDRMDAQFIAELFALKTARSDHEARQADMTPEQRERQLKDHIKVRKAEIVKRRLKHG
jgi:hypothetical protein